MKKFTILMSLFCFTIMAGSAFAESVTFSSEQIKKIEEHIVGLDNQVAELTAQNKTQSETIKTMMQIIKVHGIDFVEASKDPSKSTFSNKSSEEVVSNLTSNTKTKTTTTSKNNATDCGVVGEFAYTVMLARQNGMSMTELLKVTEAGTIDSAMGLIIKLAFEKTRYGTEKYKIREAEDHRTLAEKSCYKGSNK